MIYTSYFAQLRNLPDDIVPISICAKAPDWYNGIQYKKLAPSYEIFMEFRNTHNTVNYSDKYNREVLSRLTASEVLMELQSLAGIGKDIVLLCYEKSTGFCHRHLVRNWLNDYGIKCEEYSF